LQFVAAMIRTLTLRILVEGELGAGDEIRVVARPAHELSIGDLFRIYTHDRHEANRLLAVSEMSDAWTRWAEGRV
jgi:MOSC domain-containing protein YiiM